MGKITVMPMLGSVRRERADTLVGCHALFESAEQRTFEPGAIGTPLIDAFNKTLTSDYVREHIRFSGGGLKITLIVEIEL